MGVALLRAGDLPEAKEMFSKGIGIKVRPMGNGTRTSVLVLFSPADAMRANSTADQGMLARRLGI